MFPTTQQTHDTSIPKHIKLFTLLALIILIWHVKSLEVQAMTAFSSPQSSQASPKVVDAAQAVSSIDPRPGHPEAAITFSQAVTSTVDHTNSVEATETAPGTIICSPPADVETTSSQRSLFTSLLSQANRLTERFLPEALLKERVNILLLGSDERSTDSSGRTDAMVLVTIEPNSKTVGMLSIPRDLWVSIPGYGEKRINTAYRLGQVYDHPGGGAALAMQTVEANLGVAIDDYILLNFDGFTQIVDTLGGIDICVPKTIDAAAYYGYSAQYINRDEYYSFVPVSAIQGAETQPADGHRAANQAGVEPDKGYEFLYIEAGQHTLDGDTALRYARSRASITADFARIQQQQAVLLAIRAKALQLGVIPKLPEMWESMSGLVETNLQLTRIMQLAALAHDIPADQIRSEVIGQELTIDYRTSDGARVLLPKRAEIMALVTELFGVAQPTAPLTQAEIEVGLTEAPQPPAAAQAQTVAWQP